MSLDHSLGFCYKRRAVKNPSHHSVRGKLLTHALFVDYAPTTRVEQFNQGLHWFVSLCTRALENLLLEIEFLIPYLDRMLVKAGKLGIRIARLCFQSPLLWNRWTALLLLTTAALLT